jgi:hypothetical protein
LFVAGVLAFWSAFLFSAEASHHLTAHLVVITASLYLAGQAIGFALLAVLRGRP